MRKAVQFLPMAAVAACAIACSGPAPASGAATFPPEAYVTTTSDSGALNIGVRTSPQPPARGANHVELTVTSASDGTPRDDLTIDVQPWMPAMNHGSSSPTVTPEGGGKYLVSDVYLYMPGTWELRTTISGALVDHATPSIAVP
jgi:hypothetical protein